MLTWAITQVTSRRHLEDYITKNIFHCLNVKFQKRKGKRLTQTHPDGEKSQIDYLLINKKVIAKIPLTH